MNKDINRTLKHRNNHQVLPTNRKLKAYQKRILKEIILNKPVFSKLRKDSKKKFFSTRNALSPTITHKTRNNREFYESGNINF